MSQKAWLVQVPMDSPMPFVQLMDWFDQTAKNGFLAGVNYTFYSNIPPPEFQMKKALMVAFTTEGVLLMDTFPMDLIYNLQRLENLTNPFWHDKKVFDDWYNKNAKGFQDPNEILSFIKILEQAKNNASA